MQSSEITLQIYHHHLKIPIETYFNTVAGFLDPWDERAYQFVVHKYLEKAKDSGIVGMVRQKRDENYVYLDAAVRYPQTMDGQVSLESMDGGKGPQAMDGQVSLESMDGGKGLQTIDWSKVPVEVDNQGTQVMEDEMGQQ